MSKIHHFETITDLHNKIGIPANEHPLFTIVRVEDVRKFVSRIPESFTYGFYAVGFKKNLTGYVKYGRRKYDFQEGVLSFTAPNQLLGFNNLIAKDASGWYLFFHKEVFGKHSLISKLLKLSFFKYEVNEALHLSKKEETEIETIFEGINREYTLPIDKFSKDVIISSLDLLFSYARRYYNRQFVTRDDVDSDFLIQFEKELTVALEAGKLKKNGIPRVSLLADKMNVSPNYLSDLLKTLTGKSTIDHIHFHLIERAKELLLSTDRSVTELSYELGFEYPQYFSQFFKEKTSFTPSQYRAN